METGKPKFFAVGEQAGEPGKKQRKKEYSDSFLAEFSPP